MQKEFVQEYKERAQIAAYAAGFDTDKVCDAVLDIIDEFCTDAFAYDELFETFVYSNGATFTLDWHFSGRYDIDDGFTAPYDTIEELVGCFDRINEYIERYDRACDECDRREQDIEFGYGFLYEDRF